MLNQIFRKTILNKRSKLGTNNQLRFASSKKPNRLRRTSIILTEDVETLGQKGEILEVAPGYARNYLFPKKFAVNATEDTKQQWAEYTKNINFEERERKKQILIAKKRLTKVELIVKRHIDPETKSKKCNEITRENLCEKMWKQYQIILQPEQIKLKSPLSELGNYIISVDLGGADTTFRLSVIKR
eukprot:TRINITY_DN3422_c0_g1_i2.p1 TRINITY_DN3422_c0_g1~~TRINITY_DN3422_c0_g1_i2.p1  ORF type:complete len:186 (+),score=21.17 TRINITY_DN3422_c0_g1_i2:43-600(+)